MNRLRFAPVLATLAAGSALVASPAFAAAPVLTDLTAAVDTSTLITAMMAVGALAIGVGLTFAAIRHIRGMSRSV